MMECPGCTFNNFPTCAISNIVSASSLNDILEGKKLKTSLFPVCHKNAQRIVDNKITKTDACDNCSLCNYLCVSASNNLTPYAVSEKLLLSDLSRLNMYLQKAIPSAVVGSEIKAKGNAREKRIDIVVKKDSTIYLVKVLSDLDKIPYYSRSYNALLEFYNNEFNGFTFYTRLLIPAKRIDATGTISSDCCTINTFIQEIQEA